jgi:competence protein ComEA
MSLRERMDSMSRAELAGLVVVLAAVLVGAAVWYVRSLPRPVAIATASEAGGARGYGGSPSPSPAPILVDVTGSVREPGVYEFVVGDRVIDAIERAGGALKGADLSALNLAAPLADGTQIVVPERGSSARGAAATGITSSGLVNINSADAATLEELSGIGEVLAAAIVSHREEHGAFASVEDLMDVSGIGPATLEEIRDQVTV